MALADGAGPSVRSKPALWVFEDRPVDAARVTVGLVLLQLAHLATIVVSPLRLTDDQRVAGQVVVGVVVLVSFCGDSAKED